MSRIFGPVDQVAWVVEDIEASMQHQARVLGIGPWHWIQRVHPDDFEVDGAPSPAVISLAIAYSGRLQLELIQTHDAAPSMYREAIAAGRLGAQHHLGFFRRDYAARLAAAQEAGYRVGQRGRLGGSIEFAYLRTERDPGTIVELVQLDDSVEAAFVSFHQASVDWDGSDPIRVVGGG